MKLDELASKSGVSARTVRYYIQRGLLPAPEFRGPDTAYDDSHLDRLKAIRRLQERHLPLDAIATELARRSPSAILKERAPAPEIALPPLAPPTPAIPVRVPAARSERRQLAPGVELLIDDDAPPWARELAEELTDLAIRKGRHR